MTRTIEDQLASLGDAVDEALREPTDATVIALDEHRDRRLPLVAAAAILVLVVLGVAFVGRAFNNTAPVISEPTIDEEFDEFVITDPLDIDLSELVARSEQRRIAEFSEQLTFDWDALPDEWEVTHTGAATVPGSPDAAGAEFNQSVEIRVRNGLRFRVLIWGTIGGGDSPFELQDLSPLVAEEIELRGQRAQLQTGSLEWIESGSLWVTITGPPIDDLQADLLLVAETLQPIVGPIPWSADREPIGETAADGARTLLSGALGSEEWNFVAEPGSTPLRLAVAEDLVSGLPVVEPIRENSLIISVDGAIGGTLVLADAPSAVDSVLFRTESGNARLPVVAFDQDRRAVAVPIENAIDPIALDFLGSEDEVLHTLELDDFPPFGSYSSGIGTSIGE